MYVLRRAARADRFDSLALLRQPLGLPASSEAAASAAYARKPHCPPGVASWIGVRKCG